MSQAIELSAGGAVWLLRYPEPERLFGPAGLRLDEWLASGQARAIKTNARRTVYRVELPGVAFHLKHYRTLGRRNWLRGSPARREHDQALALAERGVPTLEPLALGEAGPAGCYLLTYTLPDAWPLDCVLEKLPQLPPLRLARARVALARALGQFLARLHEAGVAQKDLHPGNVLVQSPETEPKLFLVDLASVRLGGALTWAARQANLVVLNRWFMLRSGRVDRLRFWRAYLGEDVDRARSRAQARELEQLTLESNLRFWRHHDRRCLGSNRYYQPVAAVGIAGHRVADLSPEALAPLLEDTDALLTGPGVTVLKHSPSSSVVELDLAGQGGPRRVIYKRFAVTAWTDPLVALLRPTPALRSFIMGHGLRLRGLPTPRPLAVWHRIRHGLRHEGYLLTEKVPEAFDLLAFVANLSARPTRERVAVLRPLIDQAARLIRVLHARGLSHRDLKAANLLVSPARWVLAPKGVKELTETAELTRQGNAAAAPQVWFIDLVGVRRPGTVSRRRRLQNLARLHTSFHRHPDLTRTDKLRFLRVYLAWGLRGRLGWKRWWREIEAATQAKVCRNLRKGRPLG